MRRIGRGHRNGSVGAEQLADAAGVDDDVRAELDAPFPGQRGQVRLRRSVLGVRRVEHQQQLAAAVQVAAQDVRFGREQVGRRTRHDQHRGVDRRLAGLRQDDGLHPEVVASERVPHRAVPVAVVALGVALAVPLHEVDRALLALHRLDQRVGQLLLAVGGGAFDAALVLEDDGAVRLHLVLPRADRIAVDVDVLDVHLRRDVGVLVEPVAVAGELRLAREDQHGDRRLQRLEHAPRLGRQRVLLRGGQVPADVLPRQDVVGGDEDAQRQRHAGGRQRALARLPAAEERQDAAPLAQRVDRHQGQSGHGRPPPELLLLRQREADHERREDQGHAGPSESLQDPVRHRPYPRHRSLSTDFAVRNRPKAMKLT